ncbi:DNA polymerase III subunit chi [Chromatocurvus halotolerans]|uniref:DNA polymerase III chi subunit n=1 Tax=Chromatocurvus halotolerans TaxID=1132028 RepID=A0A4R2L1E5_9GAMM|nr:DNA polymerase III subunit chi [Chromatocurvus halotolerans]TCO77669.1 DNA polymerase III chi subunit [Chromatocurvus halotolerans]
MTRVGFYVVQAGAPAKRLQVAARLADKAFQRGHAIFFNCASQAQAEEMDDLLWRFRPDSFLPHGLINSDDADRIAIGWGQDPQGHDDLLINLDLSVPAFFSRFHRVAEVVTQDPQSLEALRASWSFYRERGFALEKHDIRGV